MSDEAILNEIRVLRQDLGSLNERMVSLRYEDLKGAFVVEMRRALGEEGRRAISSDLDSAQVISTCSLRSACLDKLRGLMHEVTGAMESDEIDRAHALLDGAEGLICGEGSPCLDPECSRSAVGAVQRTRALLELYSRLVGKFQLVQAPASMPSIDLQTLDVRQAEQVISPLANGHRLTIMELLARQDMALSEIGRALGMPTGHLQFHMRALKDIGFVGTDRRSRVYVLTPKGRAALRAVREMVARISRQ